MVGSRQDATVWVIKVLSLLLPMAQYMSTGNTLRLLTLPEDVIAMLEEGTLTSGQARPLIGLHNASAIAEEVVSKNYSARKVEYLVKSKKGTKSYVI